MDHCLDVGMPEEMDAFADGMTAGHLAGKAAIKARRADLPVGLSLAIVDDVLAGDDASVRDRKRAEVYERWLELARDDDFVGVQNCEGIAYDAGAVVPAAGRRDQLVGLLDVMDEGVPVLGYLHWTLMDNIEWVFGYGHQLGLHEVDRQTFARTPKPSAGVYAAIARAGTVSG